MNQMEQLWQFMQEDLKADRLANSMKHSTAKANAEKAREVFMEQQRLAKQISEQAAAQADRKDVVKDAVTSCAEKLAALSKRLAENPPADLEEIRKMIAEAERYRKTIMDFEQELKRLQQQGSEMAGRVQKINMVAAKAKQDFDKFKKEYQDEVAKDSGGKKEELQKLRAGAKELGDQIPAPLMQEYLAIKKHTPNPIARLINGACSGCNTTPPAAMLAKINVGAEIVECETCGRMLIK